MKLQDGTGSGNEAKVDNNNRLQVKSVSVRDAVDSIEQGKGYSVNTGTITFSAAGTLLYIENNEDTDLVIESVIIGLGSGTVSDSGEVTITRGPSGGDLITDATVVDVNQNRNFGSSETLDVNAYKGKSGGTITGGDQIALIYTGTSSRNLIGLDFILPKGTKLAISYDPKLSSGSIKAYCAAVVYLK